MSNFRCVTFSSFIHFSEFSYLSVLPQQESWFKARRAFNEDEQTEPWGWSRGEMQDVCYLSVGQKECLLTMPEVLCSLIVNYWITHHSAARVHWDKCCLRKCDRAHFYCLLRLLSRVIAPAVAGRRIRARETCGLRPNATVEIHSQYALKAKPSCSSRTDEMNHCASLLWIWKLITTECVWRRQRRATRATSSCSLHTFCIIPSCALLQGSKCWNKPWMNKVLFFNV